MSQQPARGGGLGGGGFLHEEQPWCSRQSRLMLSIPWDDSLRRCRALSGLILSAIRSILLLDAATRNEDIPDQCATLGLMADAVSAVEPHRKGNRMKNTFMMLWAPGPAWVPGKTVRNQPYWAQHAAFMDRLFENGTVVLGGPFADATGSLVIVEAENEHEVADVFASDPFVVHAIFVPSLLKQWLLFLDARSVR